ncbi:hypothetical protein ACFQ1S_34755 [Kibdelosporangium lantanae]|uniref:Uncharacterized protein n=1 Tax=Kibdelosporangium lantanae TaxID=1497396 RepID=A0ABW3MJH3_9PSEU
MSDNDSALRCVTRTPSRTCWPTGMRSEQLCALFSGATDSSGRNIGNDLWTEIFDSFQNGLNQPEVVYPIMRDGLNGLQ